MTMKEKIQQDMITAMKAHDDNTTSVLRMLKAAILKFETSAERKVAGDEDVMAMIGKEVKQRRDSIEEFKKGGRNDLAEKEEKELMVLQTYLPAQMTEAELKQVIESTMAETGVTAAAEKGKLMGALMPKIKGKADGALANKIVMSLLK